MGRCIGLKTLERHLQPQVVKFLTALGYEVERTAVKRGLFGNTGTNGRADLTIYLRGARVVFLELKRPGVDGEVLHTTRRKSEKKTITDQRAWRLRMESLGFTVLTASSIVEATTKVQQYDRASSRRAEEETKPVVIGRGDNGPEADLQNANGAGAGSKGEGPGIRPELRGKRPSRRTGRS